MTPVVEMPPPKETGWRIRSTAVELTYILPPCTNGHVLYGTPNCQSNINTTLPFHCPRSRHLKVLAFDTRAFSLNLHRYIVRYSDIIVAGYSVHCRFIPLHVARTYGPPEKHCRADSHGHETLAVQPCSARDIGPAHT